MDNVANAVEDAFLQSNFSIVQKDVSAMKLNEFIPSKSNTTINTPPFTQYSNILRFAANSKNLNSQTDFYVTGSQLFSGLSLCMSVVNGSNSIIQRGWGVLAIRYLEIFMNNSNISPQRISGKSLFDYIMLSAPSKDARQMLLEQMGEPTSITGYETTACVPLACFLMSANGNNFPLDMSQVGNIRVTVTFNDAYSFLSMATTSAPINPPTQLSSCELVGSQISLNDTRLSFQALAESMPDKKYVFPARKISYGEVQIQNYDFNSEKIIYLNDAPDCHLTGISLNLYQSALLSNLTLVKMPVSANIESCELTFNGQPLVKWNSLEEYGSILYNHFEGDDLTIEYPYSRNGVAYDPALYGYSYGDNGHLDARTLKDASVIYLPLGYHARRVLSENHHELTNNYAGKSLQLKFKANPFYKTSRMVSSNTGSAGVVAIDNIFNDGIFTYVNSTPTLIYGSSSSADATLNVTYYGEASIVSQNNFNNLIS